MSGTDARMPLPAPLFPRSLLSYRGLIGPICYQNPRPRVRSLQKNPTQNPCLWPKNLLRCVQYWARLCCYALSGTELGYAATRLGLSPTDDLLEVSPGHVLPTPLRNQMREPASSVQSVPERRGFVFDLGGRACAMECPVLTCAIVLPGCSPLTVPPHAMSGMTYAMSGTDLRAAGIRVCLGEFQATATQVPVLSLACSYAHAVRSSVLRSTMPLPGAWTTASASGVAP
eukprot:1042760-Rhodomonas_salina.1